MEIANIGSDINIAAEYNMEYIVNLINSGKSIEERGKELAAAKKKINKEIASIPIRIDEINRNLPSNNMRTSKAVGTDITEVKRHIFELEKEIDGLTNRNTYRINIEAQIKQIEAEKSQSEVEYQAKVNEIKSANKNAEYEHKQLVNKLKADIESNRKFITECDNGINDCEKLQEKLRAEYKEVLHTVFTEDVCPCCGRPWEPEMLQEKKEKFLAEKADKLNSINKKGLQYKESIENNKASIAKRQSMIVELEAKLKDAANSLVFKPLPAADYSDYNTMIDGLKKQLEDGKPDISRQECDIKLLQDKLAELEQELSVINGFAKQKERIAELEQELQEKVQAVADIEQEEAKLKAFVDKKIGILNEQINSMFSLVKFKLYDTQINGSKVECCEATINGVPYNSNLNTSAKVNAGLDIINVLQSYYNIYAPVFIDNKEGVNYPLKTNCQTVYLTVTKDKELIINKEVA